MQCDPLSTYAVTPPSLISPILCLVCLFHNFLLSPFLSRFSPPPPFFLPPSLSPPFPSPLLSPASPSLLPSSLLPSPSLLLSLFLPTSLLYLPQPCLNPLLFPLPFFSPSSLPLPPPVSGHCSHRRWSL